MSSTIDSDAFASNEDEYLSKLTSMRRRRKLSKAKQKTRYQNRNNSNNDSEDDDDVTKDDTSSKVDQTSGAGKEDASGTSKNQDEVLTGVNLTRSGSEPKIDLTVESADSEEEDREGDEVDAPTELKKRTVKKIEEAFPGNRLKPDLTGIKGIKQQKYTLKLAKKNENTILDETDEITKVVTSYYIEAVEMIEILKTDRVERDDDCWIPTQVPDIRAFQ